MVNDKKQFHRIGSDKIMILCTLSVITYAFSLRLHTRQGKAQKIVAIEWHVTEKYIQILNKRLILYFQSVLE